MRKAQVPVNHRPAGQDTPLRPIGANRPLAGRDALSGGNRPQP